MSAPSRRPEIRRRRTRKEKIAILRKRYAAAATDADCSRLAAKLHIIPLWRTRPRISSDILIYFEQLPRRIVPREFRRLLIPAMFELFPQRLIHQNAVQGAHDLKDVLRVH